MDNTQKKAISTYIKEVSSLFEGGRATELSYRSQLEKLLKSLLPGIEVIHEPKQIECGAPDYVLLDNEAPLGYIEAKKVQERLDAKQHKEQFERYSSALDNIIFTNYLEFRHVRDGELSSKTSIAKIENEKIIAIGENFPRFYELTQEFREYSGESISSPEELAKLMARKSHLLADAVKEILGDEEISSYLRAQADAFKECLMPVSDEEFADMYAQTIVYGMFAARLNGGMQEEFSRIHAARNMPTTSPFLHNFFQNIAGLSVDRNIERMIDNIAGVFDRIDVPALLEKFNFKDMEKDPFIHFYEPFLEQYDSKLRKSRGVYYTPWQVVSFIVRGVDDILKKEFNIPHGLADRSRILVKEDLEKEESPKQREVHKVQILDPAAGTGTFLSRVVSLIRESFSQQEGAWHEYVEEDLIPRLHGFEIMMAPYAMAHLKLRMSLRQGDEEQVADAKPEPRLRMFLTDALDRRYRKSGVQFAQWLTDEAKEANQVKTNMPIMVILGNPPYKGESKNNESWIQALLEDYKKESGGAKIRNAKWINNDYVKFIRCAQDYIDHSGEGVLAFITDHGYLSNPTFQGMRWSLLQSFDEIRVLDLHGGGGSKKKERAPDGSPDENVFDIQQGVAISFFIKKKDEKRKFSDGKTKTNKAKVKLGDLYGKRQSKYEYLVANNLHSVDFQEITPREPEFLFVPMDYEMKEEYDEGFSVSALFPTKTPGIITARDPLTIHHTRTKSRQAIEKFLDMSDDDAREYFKLRKDAQDWTVRGARQDLKSNSGPNFENIRPIMYRPFDERYTYYTGKSRGFHCRPRIGGMRHFLAGENIGLVTVKTSRNQDWCEVFVSKEIISGGTAISPLDLNYCYPLYCYSDSAQHDIEGKVAQRTPNLDNDIVQKIAKRLGMRFVLEKQANSKGTFAPLDLLDYIYAVLYSPNYRKKYNAYLKRGFPRVPYPVKKQFGKLVECGAELRALHLMQSNKLGDRITTYLQTGNHVVEKVQRDADKVMINATQFFGKVPDEAWNAHIGKYQPAQKWLEDRKGQKLSSDDITHYQKIIVALVETGKIMKRIDKILALDA